MDQYSILVQCLNVLKLLFGLRTKSCFNYFNVDQCLILVMKSCCETDDLRDLGIFHYLGTFHYLKIFIK